MTYKKGSKTKDSFNVERWDAVNTSYSIPYSEITPERKYSFPLYSNPNILRIVNLCQKTDKTLNDFTEVVWGVKVYEKGKGKPTQKGNENKTKVFHSTKKESATYRPLIGGKDIFRYNLRWKGTYLNYGKWLAAPRNPNWFQGSRIVIREVTTKGVIQATLIDGDYVFSNSVDGVRLQNNRIELKYLLGLINSKLISFYHTATSPNAFKGTFPKILLKDLRELPIPEPEKIIHDQIVILVDSLLKLNEQLQTIKLETQRQQIQRTINHTERKIDELVYELYGLNEDEIKIIEKT